VPTAIVKGVGYVSCFTIDDAWTYWQDTARGGLFRANKVDGTDQATLAPYANGYTLVADSSALYWTSGVDLWRLEKGTSQRVSIAQVTTSISSIRVDPPTVFFTESDSDGGVFSVLADGGSLVSIAAHQVDAKSIAVDSAALFFIAGSKIWQVGRGGLPAAGTLSAPVVSPSGLAIDSTSVYWSDLGYYYTAGQYVDGGIASTARMGIAGRTDLALSQPNISSLAIDDSYVYWAMGGAVVDGGAPTGELHRVPKGGGPEVVLVRQQDFPHGLAVDNEAIYWLEGGTNTIWRLAKYAP
jgi:hypothetical protein